MGMELVLIWLFEWLFDKKFDGCFLFDVIWEGFLSEVDVKFEVYIADIVFLYLVIPNFCLISGMLVFLIGEVF